MTTDLQTISLVLGIIGSLGTFIGALRLFFSSRIHLEVRIEDATKIRNIVQLFVEFENKSSSPITISRICIKHGSSEHSCELLEKRIRHMPGGITYKTPLFPLNLFARTGYLYFLEFVDAQDISIAPGNKVDVVMYTNRGKIKKNLLLPAPGRYLHMQ